MELLVDHVSVSDSEEGCEVHFGRDEGEGHPYLLLQRHFEDPGSGSLYLETHDPNCAGHLALRSATLSRDRFRVELLGHETMDVTVTFRVTAQQYKDVARALRILIPALDVVEPSAGDADGSPTIG